jgi:hypothetical protein
VKIESVGAFFGLAQSALQLRCIPLHRTVPVRDLREARRGNTTALQ